MAFRLSAETGSIGVKNEGFPRAGVMGWKRVRFGEKKSLSARAARNVDCENPRVVAICLVALTIERLKGKFGWRPEGLELFLCRLP